MTALPPSSDFVGDVNEAQFKIATTAQRDYLNGLFGDDGVPATARAALGVDAAGTDNSTNVTLAAGLDYLTIAGQIITLGSVDLAADVTGNLPVTNLNSGTNAGSTTVWHGDGIWRVPAGGEANTASNQGVGGIGPFDTKSGIDLQFRNLISDSGKVLVTLDAPNKEIDFDIDEEALSFDTFQLTTDLGVPAHQKGRMFYDEANDTFAFYISEADVTMQVGQEAWLRAKNNTGSTITNGQVVYINGIDTGILTIALAKADAAATSRKVIGIATHNIENGTIGIVTRSGTVRDVDTSGFAAADILYLSAVNAGQITNVAPTSPNFLVQLGNAGVINALTGAIEVDITIGSNTSDVIKIFNGAILEDHVIDVTSNGVTVTASLDNASTGVPLSLFFNGLFQGFSTPASVSLTPGSDTSPTQNFIYIPEATGVLTVSTVGFPAAQHVPVATVVVQSASGVQTDGAYKVHAWTDHLSDVNDQGHLSHVNRWVRGQHATWLTGMATTTAPIVGGGTSPVLDSAVSSGTALQLHEHSSPAYDTAAASIVFIQNHPTTAYLQVGDLTVLVDADNVSLSGRRYNHVLWQVVSEDSGDSKLMLNLPTGSYGNDADAINDVDRTANLTVPAEFTGTAVLVARITVQHRTPAGGTFEVLNIEDLTGTKPGSVGGGGGTGAVKNEFDDNVFRVNDVADNAKKLAFDVSGVTTGNTRTMTVPDADITLGTDADAIHGNVAGELSVLTLKGTPVSADLIVIEDSEDSNNKKRITVGSLPTGGGGEANTGSNVGTAGVGTFKQKTGVDFEFRNINTGSSKISVTLDTPNNEIDIDVVEANLTLTASQISDFDAEVASNSAVAANTAKVTNQFTAGDETKLDGIEPLADVTDATNVASAGAGMLDTEQVWTAAQQADTTTLTSTAGSIAIELSDSNDFEHTFDENATLANPTTPPVKGQKGQMKFIQDPATPRTLSYGSQYVFIGGTALVVTPTIDAEDVFDYRVLSTSEILLTAALNVS